MRSTSSNITSEEGAQQKRLAKGKATAYDPKKEKKLTVFAATKLPAWQERCIELVRESFDKINLSVDVKSVSKKLDKADTKKGMPFVNVLKKRLEGGENAEKVFEMKLGFDELEVLKEMVPGLKQTIPKCAAVELISVEQGGKKGSVVGGTEGAKIGEVKASLPQEAEKAVPGSPSFLFENL